VEGWLVHLIVREHKVEYRRTKTGKSVNVLRTCGLSPLITLFISEGRRKDGGMMKVKNIRRYKSVKTEWMRKGE
jgi:3,4-dihydroxy-2-butanone 4-phosphate synthase